MEKTPRYNVIVSDRARQMLGIHVRFLANASPAAARKAKAELMKAIRSLAVTPQRYPFMDSAHIPSNRYHRMLVYARYLILYQIKDNAVYVDYILDCRQDYEWLVT